MYEYIMVGTLVGHEVSKNKIVKNSGIGLCDFMMMETMKQFWHSCAKVLMRFLAVVVDYSSCRYELSVLDRRSSIWALYLWTGLRWLMKEIVFFVFFLVVW